MNIILNVPIPPSPNRWPRHPMKLHREKGRYQARVWVSAIMQALPMSDPPQRVRVTVTMWVRPLRDADNLVASCKWLLDALRQKQAGKVRWRRNLYVAKGYFYDDDPEHMQLDVKQFIGRPSRCTVKIEEGFHG